MSEDRILLPPNWSDLLTNYLSSAPPQYQNQWFLNQELSLDGYSFVRCRFDSCTLYVRKGTFLLENCFFSSCRIIFGDEAQKVTKLFTLFQQLTDKVTPTLAPTIESDHTISIK